MKLKNTYFEKVSYEQFRKDWLNTFHKDMDGVPGSVENMIEKYYDSLEEPCRATAGSAGYDFCSPYTIVLTADRSITIPTGFRCHMDDGVVLALFPRSGHGFKYGVHLANTTGIVDQDYFDADNEGHIFVKLINDSALAETIRIARGEAFCQGVFFEYGTTTDDAAEGERTGGFGSTTHT